MSQGDPLRPVCPLCHGPLLDRHGSRRCAGCAREFALVAGFPDLTLDIRFDDDPADEVCSNEDRTGRFLAESYLHPLLRRVYPDRRPSSLRILSVGCGVGAEIEALNELGYEAWGLDAGNRSRAWTGRRFRERYVHGNALSLPFPAESFDLAIAGCVIPHIGVEGDTYVTTADCRALRDRAARELARVIRRSAYVLLSSPNRLCPIDLFHRHGRLSHLPRLHRLSDPFLLSFGDYRRLMLEGAGCSRITPLPVRRYWGFFTSSSYGLGRVAQLPVKLHFEVLSWRLLRWLLPSPVNPWLVVLVQK